jgi:OOP family OmpA-OmpF porin
MKKIFFTALTVLSLNFALAQIETVDAPTTDFNKWSFEIAGGLNKPARPMSAGYTTTLMSPFSAEAGVRYMFNNKFGLKTDFGFSSFTGNSNSVNFDSKYYRVDLQGVANLGRIMNFETWTKTIGLLGHAGFGLSFLERTDPTYVKDRMGNFMAGVTAQIKLTNRIALTADFSGITHARQNISFDGNTPTDVRGFSGQLFTGTIGLAIYLGKNKKHADWVIENDDRFDAIDARFMAIENKMLDTDKDGVADYLDEEPNKPQGSMVDTKGRLQDKNNNGIADDVETFITNNNSNTGATTAATASNNELVKSFINGGYIAVYFDFNKSEPTNVSTEGIDFMLTYLRNNPNASIDIYGHADEIGRTAYNDKLSNARATSIKNTLLKANVDAARLNVIAAGEDQSVDVDSENARKLVRRVTFRVK